MNKFFIDKDKKRKRNDFLGIAVLQHLTRVTKNIDLGAEFLYQASPMMPGGHIGLTSFVARYRGKNQQMSLVFFEKNCST